MRSPDLAPACPKTDARDCGLAYAEFGAQLSLEQPVGIGSDVGSVGLGQFGATVCRAGRFSIAATCLAIGSVVEMCAGLQVVGIAAGGVIAPMAHEQFFGNCSVDQDIGVPMSAVYTADVAIPITGIIEFSAPDPTGKPIRNVNAGPESSKLQWRHRCDYRTEAIP